jgi:hypothetical protein
VAHVLAHDPRHLPGYLGGMSLGVLTGLRLALEAHTRERIHQERLVAAHPDSKSTAAAPIAYADAALVATMKVIAARLRQLGGAIGVLWCFGLFTGSLILLCAAVCRIKYSRITWWWACRTDVDRLLGGR